MKTKESTSVALAQKSDAQIIDKELFARVREILNTARGKTYAAVSFAMVEAYWSIGREIVERQGGADRATYGDGLISSLSKQLTDEYGKGFDQRNLRNMRQFHVVFPNWNALRAELSWTHYRLIMSVENEHAREYYLQECASGNWSTRQLERQINSHCYERVLASRKESREKVKNEIIKKEPGKTVFDVIKVLRANRHQDRRPYTPRPWSNADVRQLLYARTNERRGQSANWDNPCRCQK